MRRCLGPQILQLFRRGGVPQYLVAVRVAPKAHYDAAGCLGLRDHELSHCPQMGRGVGHFLLSVLNATLVEGEVSSGSQKKLRSTSFSSRSIPNSMPSTASLRDFSSCE